MAEGTIRQVSDEDRQRDRILESLDVTGEPVDEDAALMNPAERRKQAAQVLYSLHRLQVHMLFSMERLGQLAGLSEEECDVIGAAGEEDALETLGMADGEDDEEDGDGPRPT